ncbi:MAG: SufS family cysteine desulfurase [Gammaproteobacteria bacterium]
MSVENIAKKIAINHEELDIGKIRAEFPVLSRKVHGKPLVYLDNAATAQKPAVVIETVDHYYREYNSNIHRGVHALSGQATAAYEKTRTKIRDFINAGSEKEIIFVRGTTEAINLVAQSYGRIHFKPGDEIIITEMEHHSNIVPWQMLCEQTGATLKVIPINGAGELVMEEYVKLLNPNTRLVAVSHISNALGTVNPVQQIIDLAHEQGALALLDGAQAAPHTGIDVAALDCDFYAFSGHKLFGPTGVGVLYGKRELLENMPPYQGGGDMIKVVTLEKTLYNDLPHKFEAGTPNIAGVIGLGAAIDYVNRIGLEAISTYEHALLDYATEAVQSVEGLKLIGTARDKTGILSFVLQGIHPHDLGTILDHAGVAIRTGHHCAMPIMEYFRIPATARASFAFYNTRHEIDVLVQAIENAKKVFA